VRVEAYVDADGDLVLDRLSEGIVAALGAIPALLLATGDGVEERLLPRTYVDDEDEAHWQRYVRPDLEHLFASRAEVVTKDLRQVRVSPDGPYYWLCIPVRHRAAWEAALMGACHALAAKAKLADDEIQSGDPRGSDPTKLGALAQIQVYQALVWLILELGGHTCPDPEVVDEFEADLGDAGSAEDGCDEDGGIAG
jgi:hypothetical protein